MWINLIGFNLLWLGLVLIGNEFVIVAIAALFAHVYFCQHRTNEAKIIVLVAAIGTVVDTVLTQLNVFVFDNAFLIPVWLIVLWCCFAATIRHSLSFLSSSKWWQALAGACFAPLSYLAGERFGAVGFSMPMVNTFVLLSVIWSVLMVLFFYLNSKISAEENVYVSLN